MAAKSLKNNNQANPAVVPKGKTPNSGWIFIITGMVSKFGLRGTVVIFLLYIFVAEGTKEQHREFIDKFFLLKFGSGQTFYLTFLLVVIIASFLSMIFIYRRRVKDKDERSRSLSIEQIMKKIILHWIIISAFCLLSCGKKKDSTPIPTVNTTGSVSYKVNGIVVTIDNANILSGEGVIFAKQLKGSILQATRYALNAQKGSNNALVLSIQTDSLQLIPYHYDSAAVSLNPGGLLFDLDFNGQIGALIFTGDTFDIEISSYQNSTISGTFSGKLSSGPNYNSRGSILITEGEFKSIPVIY
jgi:hypothetical protein